MPSYGYGQAAPSYYGQYNNGTRNVAAPDMMGYPNIQYPGGNIGHFSPRMPANPPDTHRGRSQTDLAALQGAAIFLQQQNSYGMQSHPPQHPSNQQSTPFATNQLPGLGVRASPYHQPMSEAETFFRGQQSQQSESDALQSRLLSIINVAP
jgi:hypothetical protein